MPYTGSVNQIESSDLTTMSFGELSHLPSNLSISTVIVPSYSVRVTRRPACSQVSSRPWRSRVRPLGLFAGLRKILTCPVSLSHRVMRSSAASDHKRYRPSPNHTGPSEQRTPTARRSLPALVSRYFAKLGSTRLVA